MPADSAYESWSSVRRHTRLFRTVFRHQLKRRPTTVLVAECDDGMWACSNLHVGSTTGVIKLTLGMARAKTIKRLYEVDISRTTMRFTSVFETEKEGAIVDGDITVAWHVSDPVGLIKQPKFDHLDAIRNAAEDRLRPMVRKAGLDEIEGIADKADTALAHMIPLREGPISWGDASTLFRLTGEGALHRHSLEEIRRARIVDREQRAMDRERINFYTEVIDSGQVSLLAMLLSNDKEKVQEVLNYIHRHDIPIGRILVDPKDPFRNAVGRLMSEADDFDLHEMRVAWLNSITSPDRGSSLNLLRESLEETLAESPNGSKST
ncbi:hypothetical protein [Amycolatopsis sp. WAC 04182]|uniref:hypothetical protein n=1 Tax=Amycolatopsis sp. WAC 04182 TaxID=2203198 RepID=UPI000F7BAC12|nr:hypothetical protein [Amycolatopsis sp. WAC 04182]